MKLDILMYELDDYSVPTLKGLSNLLNQVVSLGMSFLPFILSPSFFSNGVNPPPRCTLIAIVTCLTSVCVYPWTYAHRRKFLE